jgi:hypothetical protein
MLCEILRKCRLPKRKTPRAVNLSKVNRKLLSKGHRNHHNRAPSRNRVKVRNLTSPAGAKRERRKDRVPSPVHQAILRHRQERHLRGHHRRHHYLQSRAVLKVLALRELQLILSTGSLERSTRASFPPHAEDSKNAAGLI